jgi:hypothetical protein
MDSCCLASRNRCVGVWICAAITSMSKLTTLDFLGDLGVLGGCMLLGRDWESFAKLR